MNRQNSIVMEEVTDEKELAEAHERRKDFDRNTDYFQAHSQEIYRKYRGKCVLIAGGELFTTDTAEEAWALAKRVHPEDKGKFVHYIPREKAIRLYGNWR